jgi:hypothetical protein
LARDVLLVHGITSTTTAAGLMLRWLLVLTIFCVGLVGYLRLVLFVLVYLFVLEAWVLRRFVGRARLWQLFSGIESAPLIGRDLERRIKRLAGGPSDIDR